jgi:hypothetical protein
MSLIPSDAERAQLKLQRKEKRETKHVEKLARQKAIKIAIAPGGKALIMTTALNGGPSQIISHENAVTKIYRQNDGYLMRQEINLVTYLHIDWFWRNHQRMFGDRAIQLFPDTKEQSESVSAYYSITTRLEAIGQTIIVIADGTTPRTASIFASLHPLSTVYSIDPMMRDSYVKQSGFDNLHAVQSKIEDWLQLHSHVIKQASSLTVVAVHSHAPFAEYLTQIVELKGESVSLSVVAIPCCIAHTLSPELEKHLHLVSSELDWGILSGKRRVSVWSS